MSDLLKYLKSKKLFFYLYLWFLILALILTFTEIKGFGIFWFDNHRSNALNIFFEAITKLGEYYIFIFFILYYLIKKSRVSFSIMALGVLMPFISYALKSYFKHPRPLTYFYKYLKNVNFKGIEDMQYHTGHNSFPSGHTFAAFAIFTLLMLTTKSRSWQIIYLLLAVFVGLSRVYLAQHFIEDVAFGSFLGVIMAILIYYIFFILGKNKTFLDINILTKNINKS
jgi:membrane-associated phospholipid phosphatase